MNKEYTTKREREYTQNRKFAEALFGIERGILAKFKSKEGIFTEPEVVNAIVKAYDINEANAKKNLRQYIGSEKSGTKHNLRELSFLIDDTLGVQHVRIPNKEIRHKFFTYSRDPAIC